MPTSVYPISPTQALEPSHVNNGVQLFQFGNKFFYITLAEVGHAEATFNFVVFRSSDNGHTWAKIADANANNIASGSGVFSLCQRGSVVYLFQPDFSTGKPSVFAFNMSTESINSSYALGPTLPIGSTMAQPVAVPLPNGTSVFLAWASFYSGTSKILSTIFNGSTWTTINVFDTGDNLNIGTSTYDADRIYLILQGINVECLTADIHTLAYSTISVIRYFSGSSWNSGFPCVCNGELVVPSTTSGLLDGLPYNEVHILRGPVTDSASMGVFSEDIVDSAGDLPIGYDLDGNEIFPGWGLVATSCIAGLLYCFYMVTNGNYASNTLAQSYLYYSTSDAPGSWSARTLVYTTPLGYSLVTPNVLVTGGSYVVLQNQINFSLFSGTVTKFSSLATVLIGDAPVVIISGPTGNVFY